MAGERVVLNPVLDDSANSPLELSGQDGSLDHGILLMGHQYPSPPRLPQWASSADTEGEVVAGTRYGNREITLGLRVAEPSTAAGTNLCTNPKCAVDTTGWTNSGLATMQRVTLYGSNPDGLGGVGADTALNIVGNSSLDYAYDDIAVTSGQPYTMTAYVYLSANSATGVRLNIYNAGGAASQATSTTLSTLNTWTRLEVTDTSASATATFRFAIEQLGAGAITAYVAGVQIENAASSTAYFDGDSPGCSWTGTHHASTSSRPATGGARFYRILEDLQQWADRTVAEGGTLMRVPPGGEPLIFDVLDAQVDIPSNNVFVHSRRAEVAVTLTCKPFWRGQWVTLSDHAETTLPVITGTDTISGGQVPGLGRLTIDEDDADDQWWVVWGMRSRRYSSAASNALFFQAEDLTELATTAVAAGAAGASGGGSNVQRNTDLTTTYQAILSTELDVANTHLSHIGSYRVFARLYRPTGNTGEVSVALEWAEGDFRRYTQNASVDYEAGDREGVFTIADLGMVTPSKVAQGTQRWEGRILAKSTVTGDEIDVDCLFLIPVDEGAGEVSVSSRITTPTSFSARDEFEQSAGNLTGGKTTNNVSAITAANPGVLTVTSHGLINGQVVWIEGIQGTMGPVLNSGLRTVAGALTNTFNVGVNTTGLTYTSGGTVHILGKTLAAGGLWYGTNDADDFSINTTDDTAERTAVSDGGANTGRNAFASTPALTNTSVRVDVARSASMVDGYQGVLARYVDSSNWLACSLDSSSSMVLVVRMVVAGSATNSLVNVGVVEELNTYYSVGLSVFASGVWVAFFGSQGTLSPVLSGSSSSLATGGALASGKVGIYDVNATAAASTRSYDNFAAWVPSVDAAIFASQSLQIREDRPIREDSAGAIWTPVTKYEGAYPRLPATGRENRTLETIVKGSRGDPSTMSDAGIDDISYQWQHAPRGITTPEPT